MKKPPQSSFHIPNKWEQYTKSEAFKACSLFVYTDTFPKSTSNVHYFDMSPATEIVVKDGHKLVKGKEDIIFYPEHFKTEKDFFFDLESDVDWVYEINSYFEHAKKKQTMLYFSENYNGKSVDLLYIDDHDCGPQDKLKIAWGNPVDNEIDKFTVTHKWWQWNKHIYSLPNVPVKKKVAVKLQYALNSGKSIVTNSDRSFPWAVNYCRTMEWDEFFSSFFPHLTTPLKEYAKC